MTSIRTRVQAKRKAASASAPGSAIAEALLAWYDRSRRDLPWRARPGESSDPYRVWLSEIMLQQTTVAAVRPYYLAFLARWPTVAALAEAPLESVMQQWAGLGYYSRARNLHACARAVADRHGGTFPDTEAELRTLPGIGPYTAAAVAAIAFGRRAVVVDGNVERVMSRLEAIATPFPAAKLEAWAAMDAITPAHRAGDVAQAVMDLGATICTPRTPACVICPLTRWCAALKTGAPAAFPRKLARKAVPTRQGAVFLVTGPAATLLVRSRPPSGLFGGMTEFPGTDWSESFDPLSFALPSGISGPVQLLGTVEHGLTHFGLTLHVFRAEADDQQPPGHRWIPWDAVENEALPTLMRKVWQLARDPVGQSPSRSTEDGRSVS